MDQLKLNNWRQRFEEEAMTLQKEFAIQPNGGAFEKSISLRLNESDEWELDVKDDVPELFKSRLETVLQETKPEDSV